MNHHCGRYEKFTDRRDFLKKAGAGFGLLALADLLQTMLHLRGMDHKRLTYFHNGRRYRLTDVAGEVIDKILV